MTATVSLLGELVEVSVAGFSGPIHVRCDGPAHAPALVALHGFSGSMRWYDLVVARLAERYRVVRLDLLGHGGTGGPAADAPLQARMVAAVLAHLDVDGATAVGHSFGADVAVELAQRSDRIERLVIVTQAPDYSDATLPRASTLMTLPLLGTGLHAAARLLARGVLSVLRATRSGPPLAVQGLEDFLALDGAMFRVVLVDRRHRMATHPLDAQVCESGKPTLVVLGGKDHFYGDRSAPRYRAAGARVEVIADSGHSPLVEVPDRLVALIDEFIPAGEQSA